MKKLQLGYLDFFRESRKSWIKSSITAEGAISPQDSLNLAKRSLSMYKVTLPLLPPRTFFNLDNVFFASIAMYLKLHDIIEYILEHLFKYISTLKYTLTYDRM